MRTRFRERPAAQARGWMFMASVGLLGIAAVFGLAFVGFNAPNKIPGRSYFTIRAQFDGADNITNHSQVRVDGRLVGQVLDTRVEDGKAVMDLQMEPDVKPLKASSTIEVRPRSAVGVRYVDIKPGATGPDLQEGQMIPASQTKITRQLDEVLGTFDPQTRANAQKFFQELGTGFAGRGQDLNDVLGEAPPMLEDTKTVLGAIAARQGSVRTFIDGNQTLVDAADPVRDTIRDGFKPEAQALRPFAQERTAIHSVLDTAPPAFTTASGRLPQVNPLVNEVQGFAHDVRPALAAGPASFAQASALLKESRPGLRNAESTLKIADKAVNPTLRLLDTVRPILPEFDATMLNSTPVLSSLGAYGCDMTLFGKQWGSMMHFGNQTGGALRFNVQFGPESVYGQQTRNGGAGPSEAYPEPCTVQVQGGR